MKHYNPFINTKIRKVNRKVNRFNGMKTICLKNGNRINTKEDKTNMIVDVNRQYRIDGIFIY